MTHWLDQTIKECKRIREADRITRERTEREEKEDDIRRAIVRGASEDRVIILEAYNKLIEENNEMRRALKEAYR